MIFGKRAQATLVMAAAVAVLAVVGLLMSGTNNGGMAVVGPTQSADYRNVGIRTTVEDAAWDMGLAFGQELYETNQGNRECITRCGPVCDARYTGKDVNNCFQFCKSGCEQNQRKLLMTGGYYTP